MNFIIRDAVLDDIPALAELHNRAWWETYEPIYPNPAPGGPTRELRERQWRDVFDQSDRDWFCLVIETRPGTLIGFAKGMKYAHADQPDFAGELNKIYLLRDYHRQGVGRRLVGDVVNRFLNLGISTMILFADPLNPSCRFFEALGAQRLLDAAGNFHGGYGWRDLHALQDLIVREVRIEK